MSSKITNIHSEKANIKGFDITRAVLEDILEGFIIEDDILERYAAECNDESLTLLWEFMRDQLIDRGVRAEDRDTPVLDVLNMSLKKARAYFVIKHEIILGKAFHCANIYFSAGRLIKRAIA